MFCPNCGAPNPDDATTCQKCGFNIKGTASPKFKGTMLMMNAQGSAGPFGPGPAAPPGVTPPMPTAADTQRGASAPNSKLKGTMIGVAPPSLGAAAPAGPAAGPVGPGAQAHSPGQISPTQVSPVSPGMAYGSPGGSGEIPAPVAMAGMDSPVHPTAPGVAGGALDAAATAMGAVGGYVPDTQPGGMPAAQATFAAAPPGMVPGGGMVPVGGQPGPPVGMMGHAGPAGIMAGQGFTQRSPFMVFLLTMVTCGIYALFWYMNTAEEMEAKGAEIGPWWHLLIPILGLIWVWKWCKGLEHVSRGQHSAGKSLLLLLFLGGIGMALLQSSINEL